MRGNKNTSSQFFQNRYGLELKRVSDEKIDLIDSHFGEMDIDEVNEIAFALEHKLIDRGEKKSHVKRIFSLFIEALQNIRLHGERDQNNTQDCFFIIARGEDFFEVVFANLSLKENNSKIVNRLEKINGFDKIELKAFYMDILTDGKISSKGGAGLGFITVALKSKNKIDYDFYDIDSNTQLFLMKTKILL